MGLHEPRHGVGDDGQGGAGVGDCVDEGAVAGVVAERLLRDVAYLGGRAEQRVDGLARAAAGCESEWGG